MGDVWTKSSYCGSGQCVEATLGTYAVRVRDSRRGASPVLVFWAKDWRAFLANIPQRP